MRTEAAHIISSLAFGFDSTLGALLQQDAPRALLFAVASFGPQDPLSLRSAFARALRTVGSALADVVGPPLYGIPSVERSLFYQQAKEALSNFFTPESLDTYLPLLSTQGVASPIVSTAIAQFIAATVRSPEYRKLVVEWVPHDQRPYRRPSAAGTELEEVTLSPKSSRGWEKPAPGAGIAAEIALASNGGWVLSALVGLLTSKDAKAQEASLEAIAALVKDTSAVALALVRPQTPDLPVSISLVHSLTKSRQIDVQLSACLCATRIVRASGSSLSATAYLNQNEEACVKSIMTIVNRILASGHEERETLIKTCYILYYLIVDDRKLAQLAFERGCLDALARICKEITPSEVKDDWDESEAETLSRLREALLTSIATFSLFDADIRRCITDKHDLLPCISVSLTCRYIGVRYAACQVVRMLSRSVGVLRTSVTDSGLGLAVFELFKKGIDEMGQKGKEPSEDMRVVEVALKALCNLVVEFSPLASKLMKQGALTRLLRLIHSEDADDRSYNLRLNAMWAIKNLLYRSPIAMKKEVMGQLGWTALYNFLNDPSDEIREQAYHILRNVAEKEEGISLVMKEMCPLTPLHSSPFPVSDRNLLDCIAELLSNTASPNLVVVQATYVVANLANGNAMDTMEIIKHNGLLEALRTVIAERGSDVRRPAVSCILQLVLERDQAKDRRRALVRVGIADTLRRVCEWAPITSAASGARPIARRTSHGAMSAGGSGGPTVGSYLHPSDRTGATISSTQWRGTSGHQRVVMNSFPVNNTGGPGVVQGSLPNLTPPAGPSSYATGHRAGSSSLSMFSGPTSAGNPHRGSSHIPGWTPEYGSSSSLMPHLTDERAAGLSRTGASSTSPMGPGHGNWSPQWYPGSSTMGAPSPSPSTLGTGVGALGVGPANFGIVSSSGHIHPAMDIDKEVYERAKRALDYLEHGDSYVL